MSLQELATRIESLADFCAHLPEGLPSTMLHMYDAKGQMYVVALRVDQHSMVAPMARLIIAKHDPVMAIVLAEIKMAVTRATVEQESDPDRQRLLRGDVSVSGMPADKRQDALLLTGEDMDGFSVTRIWVAHPPARAGGPPTYQPFASGDMDTLSSRMHPLFMFRDVMAKNPRLNTYRARTLAQDQAIKELARLGVREQHFPPPPNGWKPRPLH